MKLVLASDLHGSALYTGQLMKRIEAEAPDRVLLLGDLLYHGPRNDLPEGYAPKQVIPMLNGIKEKIVAVRGNCEAEVDQMVLPFPCLADYAELLVDGKLFHLSHGHHQNPQALPPLPEGSIFLFGHTHVKLDETVNGIPYKDIVEQARLYIHTIGGFEKFAEWGLIRPLASE